MSVIYKPWTGKIGEDMKHIRIFDSYEAMVNQIAREQRVDPANIKDGGYAARETEDTASGFSSSNYLCIYREKHFPIKMGLFSLDWNKDIIDVWAHIREGIIYRPSCGNLEEAMDRVMYFNTFEDLRTYIAEVYNSYNYIKLNPEEIVASGKQNYDDRTGWIDTDYLCIDSYEKIEDKEGYEKFFGSKCNIPQCIGFFATKWNCNQPNGILKSPGV